MAVLAAENVSYTYQSKYQKVQALKNVSCTFEAGKFYAIIGQSGSGKRRCFPCSQVSARRARARSLRTGRR